MSATDSFNYETAPCQAKYRPAISSFGGLPWKITATALKKKQKNLTIQNDRSSQKTLVRAGFFFHARKHIQQVKFSNIPARSGTFGAYIRV